MICRSSVDLSCWSFLFVFLLYCVLGMYDTGLVECACWNGFCSGEFATVDERLLVALLTSYSWGGNLLIASFSTRLASQRR